MRATLSILFLFIVSTGAAMAQCAGAGKAAPVEGTKCALPERPVRCHEACLTYGDEITKTIENTVVTGTVKCAHCDLHKGDQCRKVLVTAEKTVYRLCPEDLKGAKLDAMSGKEVNAKGTLYEVEDGDAILHLIAIEAKS